MNPSFRRLFTEPLRKKQTPGRLARAVLRLDSLEERATPAVFTVTNTTDSGAGSLRQAILDANAMVGADTIDFNLPGSAPWTINVQALGQLTITDPVTIAGPGTNKLAVVNVQAGARVFNINIPAATTDQSVTFSGFEIRGGNVTGAGGGIQLDNEKLTLTDMLVTGNVASVSGGGVHMQGEGTLTVVASTISGNSAGTAGSGTGRGGGVSLQTKGTVTLANSTVTGNQAADDGGGFAFLNGGTLTVTGSTVSANSVPDKSAHLGGGFYFGGTTGTTVTVRSSTVSGNQAGQGAGFAIDNPAVDLQIQNSTVTANTARTAVTSPPAPPAGTATGGGIARTVANTTGQLRLVSTILAGNALSGVPGSNSPDIELFDGGLFADYSLIGSLTGIVNGPNGQHILGSNNVTGFNGGSYVNPNLGPLQDNGGPTLTHLPGPTSPARNAGSNPLGLTADQRGSPRMSGQPDIGSTEASVAGDPYVLSVVAQPVTSAGGTSYQFTIVYDDTTGLNLATINGNNNAVRVTGPGGFDVPATFVSIAAGPGTNPNSRAVTYQITPPGGSWNDGEGGFYNITIRPNQVADVDGNFVPAGTVGVIRVELSRTLVVTDTNDSGPGTLRQAVYDADVVIPATADTITFDPAAFGTPRAINLTAGQLRVTNPLTVTGPGSGLLTINGGATGRPDNRIFNIDGAGTVNVAISGVTLSKGNLIGATNNGGAIRINDETVILTDVVISGNQSQGNGGGIALDGQGNLTLVNSTVSGNAVTTNPSGDGGGIADLTGGRVTLRDSTVQGNSAPDDGGGIMMTFGGFLTLQGSTISGNSTGTNGDGGGIYLTGPVTAEIKNSTISGNTAGSGGGIAVRSANVSLAVRNSTITLNTSLTAGGGGIARSVAAAPPGQTVLTSTIIAGNNGGAGGSRDVTIAGGALVASFSLIQDPIGLAISGTGNILGQSPNLGPLQDNGGRTRTHLPGPASPALNKGANPDPALDTDQRGFGFVRVFGSQADIGAVELQPPAPTAISTTTPSPTNATAITFTVTFNLPVSGLTAANFTLVTTGGVTGTIGAVTGSGTTWTVPVTGITGSGTLQLRLATSTGITPTPAGIPFTGPAVTIDQTAPSVQSVTRLDPPVQGNGVPVRFRVVFTEPVVGVSAGNFAPAISPSGSLTGAAVTGAVQVNPTTYDVTVTTGTGNGNLGLILANSAGLTDAVGNPAAVPSTGGETYAVGQPIVNSLVGPPGINGTTADYTLTFNQPVASVTAGNFLFVTVTGTAAGTIGTPTGSGTTWTIPVTGITGNGSFRIDMVNNAGTTPPVVGLPVQGTVVQIDRVAPQLVSVTNLDPLVTNLTTVRYQVVFNEPVVGLTPNNFILTQTGLPGAAIGAVTGSGATWVVAMDTGVGEGTLSIALTSTAGITDLAGNPLVTPPPGTATGPTYDIDAQPPTVTGFAQLDPPTTTGGPVRFRITFSEPVATPTAANFAVVPTGTVTGAGVVGVTAVPGSNGTAWDVTVNPGTGEGAVGLNLVDSNGLADPRSNPVAGLPATGPTYAVDTVAPAVTGITRSGPAVTNANTVQFFVTFREPVAGLSAANFTVANPGGGLTGAAVTSVIPQNPANPFNTDYTVTVSTGSGSGDVRLDLTGTAGVADPAGNQLAAPFTAGDVITIDRTPPTVLSIAPVVPVTNAAQVQFTVTFSEPVTGVTAPRFALATTGSLVGTGISSVTGSGATWTVTVDTGAGDGTITVNLIDPTGIADAVGNPLPGTRTGTPATIDRTRPLPSSISLVGQPVTNAPSVQFTVTFNEPVVGPAAANFRLTGAGTTGAAITSVTGSGATWTVTVSTGTGDGTIGLELFNPVGITDVAGNLLAGGTLTGPAFTIDQTPPTVTISRSPLQEDPTAASPIRFTVTFSEPVIGFDESDVVFGGTAGATSATVTGSGATYTVRINGMTQAGTVTIGVAAGAAQDAAGNPSLAPTGTAPSVTFLRGVPTAPDFYSTPAQTRLFIPADRGVLANDGDAVSPARFAQLATPPHPSVGSVELNPDGSFVFTPAPGFAGNAVFSYVASDGVGTSIPTDVTIRVVTHVPRIAASAGPGGGPQVIVYDQAGRIVRTFYAYAPDFTGGVQVATGDVNGDGVDDVVTGTGIGGGPNVRVFDGLTGEMIASFFAYEDSFRGGVQVAVADIDGDGLADIITGTGAGGGPRIQVFSSGRGFAQIANFFAYTDSFRGGVQVAGGDVDGDGRADILAGAGPGGGPHVAAFRGTDLALIRSFFAFDPSFDGGLSIAAGDAFGDGTPDIIVGATRGSSVRVFDSSDDPLTDIEFPFPQPTGGVRVATKDTTNDGRPDQLLMATGPGDVPRIVRFNLTTMTRVDELLDFPLNFLGGIYVG